IPSPGDPVYPNGVDYDWYALAGISNPNIPTIPSATQSVAYTPFNKVYTVQEDGRLMGFTYGPDEQRMRSVYINPYAWGPLEPGFRVRTYSHNYEETEVGTEFPPTNTSTTQTAYVHAGGRLVAMLQKSNGGATQVRYAHTDHLGSLTHILNTNGTLHTEQGFDAWGRRRDAANWGYVAYMPMTIDVMDRGFTGHEH